MDFQGSTQQLLSCWCPLSPSLPHSFPSPQPVSHTGSQPSFLLLYISVDCLPICLYPKAVNSTAFFTVLAWYRCLLNARWFEIKGWGPMVRGSSFADCCDHSWSHTKFILSSLIPNLVWEADAIHRLSNKWEFSKRNISWSWAWGAWMELEWKCYPPGATQEPRWTVLEVVGYIKGTIRSLSGEERIYLRALMMGKIFRNQSVIFQTGKLQERSTGKNLGFVCIRRFEFGF